MEEKTQKTEHLKKELESRLKTLKQMRKEIDEQIMIFTISLQVLSDMKNENKKD